MNQCIICNKELKDKETEECPECQKALDEKYKGDKEGRALSKRYFRWLKARGKDNETHL